MLIDGYTLPKNAKVFNSKIDLGPTLPADPTAGYIFLLTEADSYHAPGLWYFDGTTWLGTTGNNGGGGGGTEVLITVGYGLVKSETNQISVDATKIPYDISGTCIGKPPIGGTIFQFLVGRSMHIPANAVGSSSKALVASTNPVQLSIQKNGVQFGQITYLSGAYSGIISCEQMSFSAGDVLSVEAPDVQDVTLANVSYTFAAILPAGA